MKFRIELTWSKIMSLIMLAAATYLDIRYGKDGSLFMFAVPFAAGMIVGKQGADAYKEVKSGVNGQK